ncbi:unnamed protein product [Choristocarpus tenellus]
MTSARSRLDALIATLEGQLGLPPITGLEKNKSSKKSWRHLLDDMISRLETSLQIDPNDQSNLGVPQDFAKALGNSNEPGEGGKSKERKGKDRKGVGGQTTREKQGPDAKGEGTAKKKDKYVQASQPGGTKIDLRVGVITKVWNHETADRWE